MKNENIKNLIKAYEKAMTYVMEHPDNLCAKCVYAKPYDEYDIDCECSEYKKHGVVSCQEGVIEYFKSEVANADN